MKECQVCGRKPQMAYRRSHSNIATKRMQKLNLQKFTHQGKKLFACTKCIKTFSKVKK